MSQCHIITVSHHQVSHRSGTTKFPKNKMKWIAECKKRKDEFENEMKWIAECIFISFQNEMNSRARKVQNEFEKGMKWIAECKKCKNEFENKMKWIAECKKQSTPSSLHTLHPNPTPYTLHPKPFTLHHKLYTLHPTPYTLHPTPYTLHPTPHTPHPTP